MKNEGTRPSTLGTEAGGVQIHGLVMAQLAVIPAFLAPLCLWGALTGNKQPEGMGYDEKDRDKPFYCNDHDNHCPAINTPEWDKFMAVFEANGSNDTSLVWINYYKCYVTSDGRRSPYYEMECGR